MLLYIDIHHSVNLTHRFLLLLLLLRLFRFYSVFAVFLCFLSPEFHLSSHIEETPATENNEASDDVKDPQSESKETNNTENEGNAKDEAPTLVEPSSEAPRGLGSLLFTRKHIDY